VHALLVELVRPRDRDLPTLDQSAVGMAATTGLCHAVPVGRGIRVRLRPYLMSLPMAVEAQGSFFDPVGEGAAVDTAQIDLDGLFVAALR